MRKKNLKKLKLSKNTVSELGTEAVLGGLSGGACNGGGAAKDTIGCAPFTLPVICHGSNGCFRNG